MSGELWPSFFVVGATKCGTTTLWAHLKRHPKVFLPEMKEPHYFLSQGPKPEDEKKEIPHCVANLAKYRALFKNANSDMAIGDCSPTYLWDKASAQKIYQVRPDAKIIAILRDPVLRAHSQFLMHRKLGGEPLNDFYAALQADIKEMEDPARRFFGQRLYIEMGLFHAQLQRYIDAFGRANVLVLTLDQLASNADATLKIMTDHLGISALEPVSDASEEKSNSYKMPRPGFRGAFRVLHRVFTRERREKWLPESVNAWLRSSSFLYSTEKPPLDSESRRLLQQIYDPEISRLEQLLGRRFPELRKSWN
jgi:hypothetical protein